MKTYEELKARIEALTDYTLNMTIKESNGLKKLTVGPTGIVDVEVYLGTVKTPDEAKFKLDLIRLVKVELGFPGVKYQFYPSDLALPEKAVRFIGIASGKGGVGKSTVTANLAIALTRLGKKVGIIDADVYGPSIPNVMQIPILPIEGTDDEKILPFEREGVQVISTEFFMPKDKPVMWRGPMLGKMLTHFFNDVKWDEDTEYILIDLPPGTGDVALDIKNYEPTTKMIIVTTPHLSASHVAVKAGFGAKQLGHDILGVVENMAYFINPVNQQKEFIFGSGGGDDVAAKLDTTVLARIPIGTPQGTYHSLYEEDTIQGKMFIALADQIIS